MSKTFDNKTVELIALGVAYALNCQKCMKVHKKAASDAGVSLNQMREALSVAAGVITGASGVTGTAAEEIFRGNIEELYSCCPEDSECCV
ncbi:MAG: carboxymuconolactone decarboxylase family protein [Sedimenticola sp.]